MQTKVIVVSEQDQTVRIYVGSPEAHQMDQTGQFRIAGPVDPVALADMAVDLASHFGWLNGTVEVPARKAFAAPATVVQLPEAVAKPPARKPTKTDPKGKQPVRCAMCAKAMVRNSLDRHLVDVHGVAKTDALAAMHAAPLDVTADLNIRRRKDAKRKNGGHGRQGLHGARLWESEIAPAVLAWMAERREPVTSADIAKRWKVTTGTGLAWLAKLITRGNVSEVTPADAPRGTPRVFALVPEPVAVFAEPVPNLQA